MWLRELGLEVVAAAGDPADAAFSRDVVVDGDAGSTRESRLHGWPGSAARCGHTMASSPWSSKRTYARMLHANFDYPFVKLAIPMTTVRC